MPAKSAPASIAARIASAWCSGPAMCAKDEPTQTDTIAPTVYWPWPPMLKSPQRKAKATASPVSASGVAASRVCCRLSAASARSSPVTQGKSQSRPVPWKMPL